MKHGGKALHVGADSGGGPEIDGDEVVRQIRPLLGRPLGGPDVALGHLHEVGPLLQHRYGSSHHACKLFEETLSFVFSSLLTESQMGTKSACLHFMLMLFHGCAIMNINVLSKETCENRQVRRMPCAEDRRRVSSGACSTWQSPWLRLRGRRKFEGIVDEVGALRIFSPYSIVPTTPYSSPSHSPGPMPSATNLRPSSSEYETETCLET